MMVEKKEENTEKRILEAAKTVFFREGVQGARMQDIADLAQINRAMLHYYFRDKAVLAQKVGREAIGKFVKTFKANLNSELSFEEKLDHYIELEIDLFYNNPSMCLFALHEASKDKDYFKKIIPNHEHSLIFRKQFKEAVDNKIIRPISIENFIISISSLCMFPFIAGPLYTMIFNWDDEQWGPYRDYLRKTLPEIIKKSLFYLQE